MKGERHCVYIHSSIHPIIRSPKVASTKGQWGRALGQLWGHREDSDAAPSLEADPQARSSGRGTCALMEASGPRGRATNDVL